MKVNDVLDHLNHIESTIPVKDWKLDGIDIWPIIRLKLYFHLTRLDLELPENPRSLSKKILLAIGKRIKYFFLLFNSSAHKKIIKADAIFLADPSYVKRDNKLYQRFCDPIIEEMEAIGVTTLTMTLLKDVNAPLFTPAYFISLYFQIICDLTELKKKLGLIQAKKLSLEGWDECITYIQRIQNNGNTLSFGKITLDLAVFKSLVDYYGKILNIVQPKCAFVVSYYDNGLNNMAYIYACKKMGIPSVDLQHGTINDLHAAYGRWTHLPSTGYNTLPNYFACWDKSSRDCINSWASNYKDHHRAVIFGNRFMQTVANERSSAFKDYLRNVQLECSPEKHVLLTLQVECGFPDILKETLRLSPPAYFWWIRFHPMMTGDEKSNAIAIVSSIKGLNYNINEASTNLLYSILPHMDMHLTLNSSVVQEASHFGVSSIVCDQTGYEYYKKEIELGFVHSARSADEVIKLIDCIETRKKVPDYISSSFFYKEIGLL